MINLMKGDFMWKATDFYVEPSGWHWKHLWFKWDAKSKQDAQYTGCWHFREFSWLWFTISFEKTTP